MLVSVRSTSDAGKCCCGSLCLPTRLPGLPTGEPPDACGDASRPAGCSRSSGRPRAASPGWLSTFGSSSLRDVTSHHSSVQRCDVTAWHSSVQPSGTAWRVLQAMVLLAQWDNTAWWGCIKLIKQRDGKGCRFWVLLPVTLRLAEHPS